MTHGLSRVFINTQAALNRIQAVRRGVRGLMDSGLNVDGSEISTKLSGIDVELSISRGACLSNIKQKVREAGGEELIEKMFNAMAREIRNSQEVMLSLNSGEDVLAHLDFLHERCMEIAKSYLGEPIFGVVHVKPDRERALLLKWKDEATRAAASLAQDHPGMDLP